MADIKNIIRNLMYSGNPVNAEVLIAAIKGYKAVSFDIFDTLLKRNINQPSDIFSLIKIDIDRFEEKRIEAEKVARKNSQEKEITIDEIYQNMTEISNKKRIIKAELDVENSMLIINKEIWPVYEWCIANGVEVFITSDMYLPKDFIEGVLTKNGIIGYKQLYLSSSYKKTKRDGTLFKILLSEQGLKANEIIHIGDSFVGDYKIPISLGIKAIRIPRNVNRKQHTYKFDSSIKSSLFNSFLNNTVNIEKGEYYQFGYECFGPMLWGYVRWLYKSITEKNISKIYFFSRDGFIMKKAFDICYSNDKIKSFYLEVSRRSLRVPVLWLDSSFETVLNMLSPSRLIPIKAIFDGVGLDINNYLELLDKYGFTDKSIFDRNSILEDRDLLSMYSQLKKDINKISRQEYELLIKYLEKNEVFGKIAVVDIGWSGGMQRFLEQVLLKIDIEHHICGYYTGVAPYYTRNSKICPDLDLNGYLFDFKNDRLAIDKRSCFVGLFETLFLEQAGSVKNYGEDMDGSVTANRYPYEYIIDGKPTDEYVKVSQVQNGALEFVANAAQNEYLMEMNFSADELFSCLRECGANPKKVDINMFADFRFFDEGEVNRLADPKKIVYYICHLRELKSDFLKCRWKTGFMKRLLKMNLPYEKLYNQLLIFK